MSKGSDIPAEDQKAFLKAQLFFWLIGAPDGHAKNFSIYLGPGGSYRLTALYDILCAEPSPDAGQIERKQMKLAMAVGKNCRYRIAEIHARHFLQTGEEAACQNLLSGQQSRKCATPLAVLSNDWRANCPPGSRRRSTLMSRRRCAPVSAPCKSPCDRWSSFDAGSPGRYESDRIPLTSPSIRHIGGNDKGLFGLTPQQSSVFPPGSTPAPALRRQRSQVRILSGAPVFPVAPSVWVSPGYPGGLEFIAPPRSKYCGDYAERRAFEPDKLRRLIRSNHAELIAAARIIADKLNRAVGPVSLVVPLDGWSRIDGPGKALHDPEAVKAFLKEIRARLQPTVKVFEFEGWIEDPSFGRWIAKEAADMLAGYWKGM